MIDRGDEFHSSTTPCEQPTDREALVSKHFLDGRKSSSKRSGRERSKSQGKEQSRHVSDRSSTSAEDWKAQIHRLLADDLMAVESLIKRTLDCRYEEVNRLSVHAANMGGKRLRPMLAILSAKACAPNGISTDNARQLHRVAASVELVHSASLLHDDVMDNALTRRHLPTVGQLAGSNAAILLGDYLFTQAYALAADCRSPYPAKRIALAASSLCQGELRQQLLAGKFEIEPKDYRRLLLEKTASLCAASCALGAWSTRGQSTRDQSTRDHSTHSQSILYPSTHRLAPKNGTRVQSDGHEPRSAVTNLLGSFSSYGRELGLAFQLFDDWLDYWGTEEIGKELGKDLNQRKPTLPLIRYLSQASEDQRKSFYAVMDADLDDEQRFCEVRRMLDASDASEYTLRIARRCVLRALNHLERLPPAASDEQRTYRECLVRIAEYSAARAE